MLVAEPVKGPAAPGKPATGQPEAANNTVPDYIALIQQFVKGNPTVYTFETALLRKFGITIAALDLAAGVKSSPAKPQIDPVFIQPLSRVTLDSFRKDHGKCKENDTEFKDFLLPEAEAEAEDKIPIEILPSNDRQARGRRLLHCFREYNHFGPDPDDWDDLRPATWANSGWTSGLWFRHTTPGWWTVSGLKRESDDWPHSVIFIVHANAWPAEGKITGGELATITRAIREYRRFGLETGRAQNATMRRYVPVTVVSASSNLLRVLHAWDDAQNPSALNIRISPILTCKDPVDQNPLWKDLCCFVMGSPTEPNA
jgi:hypothetical protein